MRGDQCTRPNMVERSKNNKEDFSHQLTTVTAVCKPYNLEVSSTDWGEPHKNTGHMDNKKWWFPELKVEDGEKLLSFYATANGSFRKTQVLNSTHMLLFRERSIRCTITRPRHLDTLLLMTDLTPVALWFTAEIKLPVCDLSFIGLPLHLQADLPPPRAAEGEEEWEAFSMAVIPGSHLCRTYCARHVSVWMHDKSKPSIIILHSHRALEIPAKPSVKWPVIFL